MTAPNQMREKLKKDLMDKISEYKELCDERDDIEEETGKTYSELCDEEDGGEYMGIVSKIADLEDEISRIFFEAKCYPLVVLKEEETKELQSFERRSKSYHNDKYFSELFSMSELHTEHRVKKIRTLLLPSYIDPQERSIYKEIIQCYVHGNFFACSALCRSLSECLAKRLITGSGLGEHITGENSHRKGKSILGILKEYTLVSLKVCDIYEKLYNETSDMLHMNKRIFKRNNQENRTVEHIRKLQALIKAFTRK